jgi:hypothetical protein
MGDQPFIVVRLVPKPPVDGSTFTTYADDLTLVTVNAAAGEPISDPVTAAALSLVQWPPVSSCT